MPNPTRAFVLAATLVTAATPFGPGSAATNIKSPSDIRLKTAVETDARFNGVTVSPEGRIFVPVQRDDPDSGTEVAEMVGGKAKPYPDADMNSWSRGTDPTRRFVGVNALRIGPDGALWVVDAAKTGQQAPAVPEGIKLLRIDLATNAVTRVYALASSTGPDSFVDDVRFNGRHAYLTDAGKHAGLIVLDLDTGAQRRVLDGTRFVVQGDRHLSGEGRDLVGKTGEPVVVNADQLEVSPDGATLYFQPCTGPLYRVPTALVDDPGAAPEAVAAAVKLHADTHSTGGSAIAGDGTIFISDTDASAVLRIAPDGAVSTLVQDPKLAWVDAMWIDEAGRLWIPAAQRNRSAGMNGGKDAIQSPLTIYTVEVGARPVRR